MRELNKEVLLEILDGLIEKTDDRALTLLKSNQMEGYFLSQGESTGYWAIKQIIDVNFK